MGSPTLFANPFGACTNYLLNPKPGEKRSFFSTKVLGRNPRRAHSVPYVNLIEIADLSPTPVEISMGNPYMSKCSAKVPFHVPAPPMKMPSLIGGYVGAKSQSAREESKLCDILGLAAIARNFLRLPDTEVLSNTLNNMHSFGCKNGPYMETTDETKLEHPHLEATKNEKLVGSSRPRLPKSQPLVEMATAERNTHCEGIRSATKMSARQCEKFSEKEDKGKPPMKKPKLNLKTCCSSRRKHKGRRKKCTKKVQCESPMVSPGYDPTHLTFDTVDEVDCCIELSNRFAPLEDISACHWSDSDSTEAPLLDMLSEMHLDDFGADLDSASPTVELFNVRPYEKSEPNLTCNSSIAFILGGNEDMTSDSEDGSFASDLDDLHWQSFKTDFEFFQDQIPFIVGSCGLSSVHFEASLDVLDDDDIFLNDLEYHPTCDAEQRLRDVNLRWNQMVVVGKEGQQRTGRQAKVCFAPDHCLTSVHYIPSGPEECQARKGPWDQCYLDRCRFERRIQEVEPVISLCLTPQHRKSVFQRLYGSENFVS